MKEGEKTIIIKHSERDLTQMDRLRLKNKNVFNKKKWLGKSRDLFKKEYGQGRSINYHESDGVGHGFVTRQDRFLVGYDKVGGYEYP